MKIDKVYRPKKGARKLDLTYVKEALKDGRCWACMGLVTKGDDGSHFELTTEDVLIEVEVQPSGERVTARLGTVAGGAGRGVWAIPAEGTEVALLMPDGDTSFMPIVVATLTTGEVPTDLDETTIVIANNVGDIAVIPSGDVSLGEAGATQQALHGNSFQTKYNALLGLLKNHVHPAPGTSASLSLTTIDTVNNITSGDLSPNVKVK